MTIYIPLWVLITAWMAVKFAAACYLQRFYILSFPSSMDENPKAFRHFIGNWIFQPEFHAIRVILWPLLNLVWWEWDRSSLLPDEVVYYRRHIRQQAESREEAQERIQKPIDGRTRSWRLRGPAPPAAWDHIDEEWFKERPVMYGWYSKKQAQGRGQGCVTYLTPDGNCVVVTMVTNGIIQNSQWDDVVCIGQVIPNDLGGYCYGNSKLNSALTSKLCKNKNPKEQEYTV